MRRRVLLLALWLAGTAGATGAVFFAVSRLSTSLESVNRKNNLGLSTGPRTATTVAGGLITLPTVLPGPTEAVTTSTPLLTVPAATSEVTSAPATEVEPAPDETTTPRTTRPATATTRPGVGTTAPPTGTTRPPDVTPTPAPTTAPPATTAPPPETTAPPVTTSPFSNCVDDFWPVKNRAAVVSYRVCTGGLVYLNSLTTWTVQVLSRSPTVSVRYTSGPTTYTCTLSGNLDGVVSAGDC